MYDNFFDFPEPTTGDLLYEEIKQLLLKTVKAEYVAEMERLRKENEELRPYKEQKASFDRQLKAIKLEYERKLQQLAQDLRNQTMQEFFGPEQISAWRVTTKYTQGPKCDRCDENRVIRFKSPLGKDMSESCTCAQTLITYVPTEAVMVKFCIDKNAHLSAQNTGSAVPVTRYFVSKDDITADKACFIWDSDQEERSARFADEASFETLRRYQAVFLSKDRCQAYCDYLNNLEKRK